MPGPWSTIRTRTREPTCANVHHHGLPRRIAHRVLQQVAEGALELPGVSLEQRDVGDEASRKSPARAPTPSMASDSTSSIEYHSRRGSSVPDWSAVRSSSFSISRASRVPA